jgi:hypothetical protein
MGGGIYPGGPGPGGFGAGTPNTGQPQPPAGMNYPPGQGPAQQPQMHPEVQNLIRGLQGGGCR